MRSCPAGKSPRLGEVAFLHPITAVIRTRRASLLRVLWATIEPPDRNLGGGSIRQAHLLDALAAEGVEITLLLFGSTLQDETTLESVAHVIEVPDAVGTPSRGRVGRRVHDLREALLANDPPEVTSYRDVRAQLERRWREFGEYDAVIIEHPGLAPLINLRGRETWLLTLHNVASGMLDQQAAISRGRRRWIYRRQAAQARAFERWSIESFDLVFSVSGDDASMLPGMTTVVPNGVDIDRFHHTAVPSEPRIVLIGTLGYLPNVDGAVWLVDEVLPMVRKRFPNVVLDLVGRSPTREVLNLECHPGVFVHADVPDVRSYFLRARLCLVPLRIGTGTRLKALEAFAAYRPVVGTSIGLGGLDIVDGEHALVADSPAEFADRVVRVLGDDAVANSLVHSAREFVEERYSWPQIGRTFATAVLSACQ